MLGQIMPDPTNMDPVATVLLNAVAATGASPALAVAGFNSVTMDVEGVFVGTVAFEGSLDGGVTWSPVTGTTGAGSTVSSTVTVIGYWALNVGWVLTHVRANVTAYTSGNISVKALRRVR